MTQESIVLAPGVSKHFLSLKPPGIDDQLPDWERVTSALPIKRLPFNRAVASKLPAQLRQANFKVTAVLANKELVAVEAGDTRDRLFGLAVDIGTTTIVTYLIDLNKGSVVGNAAVTNPQSVFGADVISRITHAATGPKGLNQLQDKVISGLNSLITELCEEYKVSRDEIYEATVVGNTTMSHLFLGIEVDDIDRVLLARAFGNFIKKESALGIGLLPKLPLERISAIGNGAGEGCKMALLSVVERKRASDIALRAEQIELSEIEEFQNLFVKSLGF